MDQWGSEPIRGVGWCITIVAASTLFIFAISALYLIS